MLRSLKRWLRVGSLQRRDASVEGDDRVENVDAGAARMPVRDASLAPGANYPPDYVKSYDEDRPRH
jgi:hypothetical protein